MFFHQLNLFFKLFGNSIVRILCTATVVSSLLLSSSPSSSSAQDSLRSEQELKALQSKILKLQNALDAERMAEQSLQAEVEEIEKQQLDIVNKRDGLNGKLEMLTTTRSNLEKKQSRLEDERIRTLEALEEIVQARFVLGRQDALRYLLDSSELRKKSKSLAIYRYLIERQKQALLKVRNIETETANTIAEVKTNQMMIDRMLAKVDAADRELHKIEQTRLQRLADVRASLGTGEQQMKAFLRKQSEIELLLQNLKQRARQAATHQQSEQRKTTDEEQHRTFSKLRGRLPKPLDTSIIRKFGDERAESGLAWDGILFEAENGDAIRAVHNGQVVYSDWFYGYGQLLVIDHGDKYMSLYAHNQQLQVIVGDWVQSGESIASAGSTGGLLDPALYFEIRVDGSPEDPESWFAK